MSSYSQPTEPPRNDPARWGPLGAAHARRGDWYAAAEAFGQALRHSPDDARAWEGLARARMALQDLPAARALCAEMQQRFPDRSFPFLLQGHLHKADGEPEAAVAAYQEALRRQPTLGEALFGVVDLQVPAPGDPLARQAMEVAATDTLPAADRINAGFAAGRILDRSEQYEAAFTRFRAANELARQTLAAQGREYSPGHHETRITKQIARYPASAFTHPLPALPIDLTPVFVVGLPRSGTTLIEQILASHPDVEAAGELTSARDCEYRFLSARQEAGLRGPVDPSDPQEAALLEDAREQYIDALFERDLDGSRIVDKLPANFERAGFLRLLFPDSPILHSSRDRRATGFSLYTANFGGHEPYYHDLVHLAHYVKEYQRIMRHWSSVIPRPPVDISYETLVAEPRQRIPALLESAGLSPHEGCLEFHRTRRPVLTASHARVRQPIYRSAVDHWRHYEPWLGPLLTLR